ncbi:gliding motility protein [Streptomyces sp. NPDC091209]|uniref:gliding motility protein n=1 Tax=Streptomyces sp. NPDC091209 TaxID=3365974 RepID=UPI0038099975
MESAVETKGSSEGKGSSETKAPSETSGSSENDSEDDGGATAGTAGASGAEDVDIPKQQTAEQAADNEAGKGSRT